MILKQLPLGAFATNCFLVFMPETEELFIIDPASEAEKIVAEAKKFPFKKARILLTHAHIDHIDHIHAAGVVAASLNIPYLFYPEALRTKNLKSIALKGMKHTRPPQQVDYSALHNYNST